MYDGEHRRAEGDPQVSVVVPAYGVGELLDQALSSLQAQTVRHWEAIVVDDGDPDVARHFARFAVDPRFRLLRTGRGGVSQARNRAIAAARAPYVAFLDGDDLYAPTYLQRMLQAASDPGLGFVACDAEMFGSGPTKGQLYSAVYPMSGPMTLARVLARQVNIFTATLVRREALLEVGGFDTGLVVAEDLDLWVRLLAAGWRGDVVAEPLVRYRRRAGSLSSGTRRLMQGSWAAYRKAEGFLSGRPEATIAREMATYYRKRLDWAEGEELIAGGRVREGLALLASAQDRSPRWRMALSLMRRAPWLAGPMLWMRSLLPAPFQV